jgi:arylsulfatase A
MTRAAVRIMLRGMRNLFLAAVFATILCALSSTPSAAQSPGKRPPNIVLILADDLGINDLACYGRQEHHTPHLDRLASQGMRFTCAYTAQPICSPSRAALMTGKCPARLHLTNYLPGRADAPSQRLLQPRIEGQLPLEEVTLPEVLKIAGYATGLFGKWHLGGKGFAPQDQGFDVVVSPPANTKPTSEEGGKGEMAIAAAAEKFMEENRDRPFFCYVPHNNPHIPLAAAKKLAEKYRDAFHPTYAAMIETLDASVGRLVAKLDALKLTDETIVIFTSDNGGLHVLESPGTPATHNMPFRAGKGFLYEGGLREPLIVRWPGVVANGSTSDTPVVLTDLVPTLLKAAGIDLDKAVGPLDGVDITRVLRSEKSPERTFYWHFPHYTNQGSRPASAIRHGNWKLIEHFEDESVELFDLKTDAGETKNCAKEQAELAQKLLADLRTWRKRVGARMLSPNPDFDAQMHRRLYIDQDPSHLLPSETAAETAPAWRDWRKAMNTAVKGQSPRITPAKGDIRLHAKEAKVHGKKLRYEPEPHKNVLGYWTEVDDWAEWNFEIAEAGNYELEIQQGCGTGSGGAEVIVEVGGKSLAFTVEETGHFQHMILRSVGEIELAAGKQTLAVRPKTKPGAAVMDLRRVVLRPIASPGKK